MADKTKDTHTLGPDTVFLTPTSIIYYKNDKVRTRDITTTQYHAIRQVLINTV